MALSERRPGVRPRQSIGRRLDIAARTGFPASITMILMLATQIPMGITGQAELLPAVTLCCIFFWSVFRPASVPPPVVFLIGLLLDLLGYLPLGVGVFTVLAVHGVAVLMRRFLARRGFLSLWIVFAAVAMAAALTIWLVSMLLLFRLLSAKPALFIAALAIAAFPALAVPFAAAHRSFANPDRA